MYSIFETNTDLKDYLGGAINASFNIEDIAPYFETAHQQRMEEWVGTALYDDLVDGVLNSDLTPDETTLLPYYRKALVWLAFFDYLPFAEVQITGSGVSRVENENYKSAYKQQVKAIQDKAIVNGYESLEKLIIFLEKNKTTYTQWPSADGYTKYHGVMLHTATLFRSVYDKTISRSVFEAMFGIVEDAELFAIIPIMGQDQYDALLNARKTDTWTTETKEKKVILLCQKISAHFTLKEALVKNYVRIEQNRIVQLDAPADNSNPRETIATAFSTGARRDMHDTRANAYIKQLCDYLETNKEDAAFSDYKAHAEALATAEEAYQDAREKEYNETTGTGITLNGERNDGGDAFGFGVTGSKNARKGASIL